MVRSRWMFAFVVLGCGPVVAPPEDDDTTSDPMGSSGSPVSAATDADDGGSGLDANDDDDDDGEDDDSIDEGPNDDGPSLDMGTAPEPSICDDPYAVSIFATGPYRYCLRGLMQFGVISSPSVGEGFDAYAQFYTVNAESQVVWDEEILDPFEGIGDCELRRYGNSGYGETEDVIWEDAGDVTFALGGTQLPADEYGDPVSVLGYTGAPYDFDIQPVFLGAYGLIATGDTTPAFDLTDAVTMPDPIVLDAPALDGTAVDGDDLAFSWVPSAAGVPLEISVTVQPSGWDYTLFCRVVDDGEFAIPSELVDQLPLPDEANVYVRRADIRIVGFDGERGILATASTATNGTIEIQ